MSSDPRPTRIFSANLGRLSFFTQLAKNLKKQNNLAVCALARNPGFPLLCRLDCTGAWRTAPTWEVRKSKMTPAGQLLLIEITENSFQGFNCLI